MTVAELIQLVMNHTDEVMPSLQILDFINDGIARINTRTSYEFAFILPSELDTEYTDLSETYQRSLLAPYASARVKANDSSTGEAEYFLTEFEKNLMDFEKNYVSDGAVKTNVGYIENTFEETYFTGGSW